MTIEAAPVLQPVWHILERDKDNATPARFKLRPLLSTEIVDVMATFDGNRPSTRTFRQCAELGVIDCENFVDEKGSPLKWNPMRLNQLQWLDVIELGAEIYLMSVNTEDQLGNSLSQSKS